MSIHRPCIVTGNQDIWICKNCEIHITLEPFSHKLGHVHLHTIRIMFEKFHLDNLKTVGEDFFIFNFSVWLLSVLRGHSVVSSQPKRPMTSDFEGFIYQIISITLFSYLNSWERASIFPFECSVLNKGTTGTIFGMTRSLTGDWTRDLPHSKPALYGGGWEKIKTQHFTNRQTVQAIDRQYSHYCILRTLNSLVRGILISKLMKLFLKTNTWVVNHTTIINLSRN